MYSNACHRHKRREVVVYPVAKVFFHFVSTMIHTRHERNIYIVNGEEYLKE